MHWSCTYDTTIAAAANSSSSSSSGVVLGSHASLAGEDCRLQLHYWPAVSGMRGCSGVSWEHEDPGAEMCGYEMEELLVMEGQDRKVIAIR